MSGFPANSLSITKYIVSNIANQIVEFAIECWKIYTNLSDVVPLWEDPSG